MEFTSRLATLEDVPRLTAVMDAAISELQRGFLEDDQIEASRAVMGLDTQLIEDATYFVIEVPAGDIAGCGGWSRRATMYGNDHSPGDDPHRPSSQRPWVGHLVTWALRFQLRLRLFGQLARALCVREHTLVPGVPLGAFNLRQLLLRHRPLLV